MVGFIQELSGMTSEAKKAQLQKNLGLLIESRMEAQMHTSRADRHPTPEFDKEGYVIGHWTDTWKIPQCTEPINVSF